MLHVDGLTKTFGTGSNKLQVLKGVDMNIDQGEMVALMGPSGSGKSTLLNIIGGLLSGDGGHILLNDKKFGQKNPSSGSPNINPRRGEASPSGSPVVNQCAATSASTSTASGYGASASCSKLPSSKSSTNNREVSAQTTPTPARPIQSACPSTRAVGNIRGQTLQR